MKLPESLIQDFIKRSKNKSYRKSVENLLLGGKKYSLNMQEGYPESEYLSACIRESVQGYTNDKETAISMYKAFVEYLEKKNIKIDIDFPPIPVNTFERQMYIAKYLQDSRNKIADLPDILWVSDRTIEEDLKRLRGIDPIQVCGKQFRIPDADRENGSIRFASTAHPLFLTENLTQVIIMLKGLKAMSENPLFENYARETAIDIWNQLSVYAKKRIRTVFTEIMPEELTWYENLKDREEDLFYSEEMCRKVHNEGPSVILDCIKNDKTFCMEYQDEDGVHFYQNCQIVKGSYSGEGLLVKCSGSDKFVDFRKVIRSAYTVEELLDI